MDLSLCKALFSDSNSPFIHCMLITGDNETQNDFKILSANNAFALMCKLDVGLIINQEGFKVLSNIIPDKNQLSKVFAESITDGRINNLYQRISINGSDYMLKVIALKNLEFVVLFEYLQVNREHQEDLEKMIQYSQDFLQYVGMDIDYQKIVDDFMQLCDGKFAVFNLFDQNGRNFRTKAIACESNILKHSAKILGFSLQNKQWDYDPVYFSKIEKSKLTYFETLNDIVGDTLPKAMVNIIKSTFGIGEVIVLKIIRSDRILGEFTVFMDKGTHFHRDFLAELYSNHVGLLLSRQESELLLEKDKQFLETTLLSISDCVISTDEKGTILLINDSAKQLTGYDGESAIGSNINEVFSIKDEYYDKPIYSIVDQVVSTKANVEMSENIMLVSRNGIVRPIKTNASPIMDQYDRLLGVVLVFSDITEMKRHQAQIGFLSFHDQLTGLYNRRYYEEELSRINDKDNLPISLVLGDVNGLKLINDSFGHITGDKLLLKVSDVIKNNCRESDVVARLGGDEFVIIMPKTDSSEADKIIKNIEEQALKESVNFVPLSISFGSATKSEVRKSFQSVFKKAEDIMYANKLYDGAGVRSKTIDLIISGLFEKNPREMNHSKRVSEISKKIATQLGLSLNEINQIGVAGLMHDIGKIGVEESILNKQTSLTHEEWQKIKRHSEIGYRILSSVNDFTEIADFVLEHHERYDGNGYPKGLKGKEISIQGRIICLADAYDAMTSPRPYGRILNNEEAIEEINKCADKHFDGEICKVFIEKVLHNND